MRDALEPRVEQLGAELAEARAEAKVAKADSEAREAERRRAERAARKRVAQNIGNYVMQALVTGPGPRSNMRSLYSAACI